MYPTLKWLKAKLRYNLVAPTRRKILAAYIVGSFAKGTQGELSDLDIAIIVKPVRGKTSLKLTELYHAKFSGDTLKIHWQGRVVDIQFFYPGETDNHERVELL